MKKKMLINQQEIHFDTATSADQEVQVGHGGRHVNVKLLNLDHGLARVSIDGVFVEIPFVKTHEGLFLRLPSGRHFHVRTPDTKRKKGTSDRSDSHPAILSPMPGKVLKVMVEQGQRVEKGTPVLVLEAMKMEHTLKAPVTGVVERLQCKVGDVVQAAQELALLAPEEKKA